MELEKNESALGSYPKFRSSHLEILMLCNMEVLRSGEKHRCCSEIRCLFSAGPKVDPCGTSRDEGWGSKFCALNIIWNDAVRASDTVNLRGSRTVPAPLGAD